METSVIFAHILLTRNELIHRPLYTCITARNEDLAKHQRELTDSNDCIDVRFSPQYTSIAVEHKIEETT